MRLRTALFLCVCALTLLAQAARRGCRKKNSGKKCDRSDVGPPRWRRKGQGTSLAERVLATAVLKCQVRANPRPKYRWFKDGKLLQPQKSKKYRRKKYRLIINSLQLSDAGQYSCQVYNPHGTLTRNFTLAVLDHHPMMELSVKERPRNQTAQVGDSVVFRCSTDSFPPPSIGWSMSKIKKPDVDIQLQKPSNRAKAEMLVLERVTKEDAGLYTCTMKTQNATRRLTARLVVIAEGEELPFEPRCSLHVRKQILYDDTYGCHTVEAVKLTYCMGSCGRSYYVPTLVSAPANSSGHLPPLAPPGHANQTCECCVGLIQGLQVVSLQCPSGVVINSFFTTLRGCVCKDCNVEGGWGWARYDMTKSKSKTTP